MLGGGVVAFFRLVFLARLWLGGFDFLEHLVGGDVAQFAVGVELFFVVELVQGGLVGEFGVFAPVAEQVCGGALERCGLEQDQRAHLAPGVCALPDARGIADGRYQVTARRAGWRCVRLSFGITGLRRQRGQLVVGDIDEGTKIRADFLDGIGQVGEPEVRVRTGVAHDDQFENIY